MYAPPCLGSGTWAFQSSATNDAHDRQAAL